jgi:hypothetical protein
MTKETKKERRENALDENVSHQHYEAACFQCESVNSLSMFCHRKNDKMVGWLFGCERCHKFIGGKKLSTMIVDD